MAALDIVLVAGIFHLALLFAHGSYIAMTFGIAWGIGRRDSKVEVPDMGRRFDRTITNNVESMVAFLPVMIVYIVSGTNSNLVIASAIVYLCARVAYAILYIANVPYLRTFAWMIGQFAIVAIVFGTVVRM